MMSSILEAPSVTGLNADLEKEILRYLQKKKTASAKEIIAAVLRDNKDRFLTSAPIVAAIWSLNSKNHVDVTGDWKVKLRDPQPRQVSATATRKR